MASYEPPSLPRLKQPGFSQRRPRFPTATSQGLLAKQSFGGCEACFGSDNSGDTDAGIACSSRSIERMYSIAETLESA
eukprot:6181638-Pleurochrysis_carterae.AAC.6